MLDKFVRVFYNIISVVVHVCTLTLILSIPVLFAVKANAPLSFKVNDISVSPVSADDEQFRSLNFTTEGWYRIDYDMTVSADKLSPYGYTIEKFALKAPKELRYTDNYAVFLDKPIEFTTGQSDDYMLTCYVRHTGDIDTVKEYAKTLGFGTRNIVRIFTLFKYEIPVNVPGFDVAELV